MNSSQKISSKFIIHYKDHLLCISIVGLMYSVSGFVFFNLFDLKFEIELISASLVLIFGFNYFLMGIRNNLGFQFYVMLMIFIGMCINLYNLTYIIDAFFSIYIIILISAASLNLVKLLIRYLITITVILSFLGLLLFLIVTTNPYYLAQIDLVYETPLKYLGSVQGGYDMGFLVVPRSQSFVIEPSQLAAYFGIPFAWLIAFKGRIYSKTIIFIFLLISTAGSIYSVFILLPIMYYLMKSLSRYKYLIVILLVVPAYFFMLINFIVPIDAFNHSPDVVYFENKDIASKYMDDKYLVERGASMGIRLGMISWALRYAIENPLVGVPGSLSTNTGFLIYSFATAGLMGLVFCFLFYKESFNKIYKGFNSCNNSLGYKISMALLAALFMQFFIFNEYGFISVHGMPLVALALKNLRQNY